MKNIITLILLLGVFISNAQIVDTASKNIQGFNRIITGSGDWLDIQLYGSGSTFKIHDSTNGGNWVRWTAGKNYTEFLKDIVLYGYLKTNDGSDYSILRTSNENNYSEIFWGDDTNDRFRFFYNYWNGEDKDLEVMTLLPNGNVGIGSITPDAKLTVNGNIHTKEVKVDLIGWSDFVFYDNYKLPTLEEVETHIKEKGHLKDIPSAKEVAENGIFLGQIDAKLLQKIEELTLYTIQQEKRLNSLEAKNENLESENQELKLINSKLLELQKRLEKLEEI